jgi:1,4-alpha-glucan branching enzyme
MTKGYLAIVLHAHLPYVRHPEHAKFLEEDWFFEAMTETYVPLLHAFENLSRDGIDFRLTLSMGPPLLTMMRDTLLLSRYAAKLDLLVELGDKEIERTRGNDAFHPIARMYRDRFSGVRDTFRRYEGNLVQAFRNFQDAGKLEIITCNATHMFLPLADRNWAACHAQIEVACREYERHFGRRPRGMWLGECGYFRGLDELLRESGIDFFFVDTHAILYGDTRPAYGVYAPVHTPAGVAAFARDAESSKQVWSSKEGYPGDALYRDFYRDIGYDLDLSYIGPYVHTDGIRHATGFKYHRITGRDVPLHEKAPYDFGAARDRSAMHAGNFLFNRGRQVEYLRSKMDRDPIVIAPYDAELFGHWWYEGPQFLEFLFRQMLYDQDLVAPITPSEYLGLYPTNQVQTPCTSSWGYKGYAEYWLNGTNEWAYRHIHKAGERMVELARTFPDAQGLRRRALNQAARELLLLQSSDWPFIMKTGTMVPYAVKRVCEHTNQFNALYDGLKKGELSEEWLLTLEEKDNIFPTIDYRVYLR